MVTTAGADAIWLVRHAATDWSGVRWCGRADPPLSAHGVAAAGRLARSLAGSGVRTGVARLVVLSSPLRRARGTAEILAGALDAGVELLDDLTEVDFGVADGLTWDEIEAAFPALATAVLEEAAVDWPGGEPAAAVRERARTAAIRVVGAASSASVVVVSHARLLAELGPLLGTSDARSLRTAGFLRVDPAPIP